MKTNQKKSRKLLDSNYPMISLKEFLERIITEGEDFPADLKSALVTARDIAWKTFIRENEKDSSSLNISSLSE